jgi:quinol monooxygenase YgiN
MLKSISVAAATLAISAACFVLLPASQRAEAQSAGNYVNAVDLDILPAEHDNFLAAIKENGAASVKEPGCKRFDIINLASDPNHFFLYEVYENEAALKAHRETDHFKKFAAAAAKMVAKREARAMSVVVSNAQAK